MARRILTSLIGVTLTLLPGCLRSTAEDGGETIVVGTNFHAFTPRCQQQPSPSAKEQRIRCSLMEETPDGDVQVEHAPPGLREVRWDDPRVVRGSEVSIFNRFYSPDGLEFHFTLSLAAAEETEVEVGMTVVGTSGPVPRRTDHFSLPFSIRTYGSVPFQTQRFNTPDLGGKPGFRAIRRELRDAGFQFSLRQPHSVCELREYLFIATPYIIYRARMVKGSYRITPFMGGNGYPLPEVGTVTDLRRLSAGHYPQIACRLGSNSSLDRLVIGTQPMSHGASAAQNPEDLYLIEARPNGLYAEVRKAPSSSRNLQSIAVGAAGEVYLLDLNLAAPQILRWSPGQPIPEKVGPRPDQLPLLTAQEGAPNNIHPGSLALAPGGALYLSLFWTQRLYRIQTSGPQLGSLTELLGPTQITKPAGLVSLPDGSLLIGQRSDSPKLSRFFPATGQLTGVLADEKTAPVDGTPVAVEEAGLATPNHPSGAAVWLRPAVLAYSHSSQTVLFGCEGQRERLVNGHLLRIELNATYAPARVSTLAGSLITRHEAGEFIFPYSGGYDGQNRRAPSFFAAHQVRFDGQGHLWVGEESPGRVLKLLRNPENPNTFRVVHVAGAGQRPDGPPPQVFSGVPAQSTYLTEISALALQPDGGLFVASTAAGTLHHISPTGVLTTRAGTGERAATPALALDGTSPLEHPLLGPRALTYHAGTGILYFVDCAPNNACLLRSLQSTTAGGWRVTTLVGNGQTGPINLSVPAKETPLEHVVEVRVAPNGRVYFSQPMAPGEGWGFYQWQPGALAPVQLTRPSQVFYRVSLFTTPENDRFFSRRASAGIVEHDRANGRSTLIVPDALDGFQTECAGGTLDGALTSDATEQWKVGVARLCKGLVRSIDSLNRCATHGYEEVAYMQTFDGHAGHTQLVLTRRSCGL